MKTTRLHAELPERLWNELNVFCFLEKMDPTEVLWEALWTWLLIASEEPGRERLHAHLENTYGEMHQHLESGKGTGKTVVSFRLID